MNSELLARAEVIFKSASNLPPEERADFVQNECGPNAELSNLVENLLAIDQQGMGDFLESPLIFSNYLADDHPVEGKWIDRYRLVRRIGQGGMGQVFLAEQQEPNRQVALKILRTDLITPALAHRFRLEIDVLGRLNNPGIAQIFDAGTTAEGHSFFAMEYVSGRTLSEFVEARSLDSRGCLELMRQICAAVQYAHDQGVIHRDLKPANVLVTEQGDGPFQAKILDFGVARLTKEMGPDASIYTLPGQLVGTLAYMSPEQAAGETRSLDPRSDVYQLGVMLYEMLAGQLPLEVDTESIARTLRRISEEEPESLGSLDISLRGDLETIVGKAMAKDPARRYSTAGELAADIQRWLAGEPIVARPASRIYSLSKALTKRRSSLLSLFAVAVIVGGLVWFTSRTETPAPVGSPRLTPLTAMQGERFPGYSLALSPDGGILAYINKGAALFRDLESGKTEPFEFPPELIGRACAVSWFPSGQEILVEFRMEDHKYDLVRYRLDRTGQATVHSTPRNAYPVVSPDGNLVMLLVEEPWQCAVLDLSSGELTTILTLDEGETLGMPVWAPDSKHLAYCRMKLPDQYLECVDLAGKVTRLLADPQLWFFAGGATSAWLPDGRLLYSRFTSEAGTASEIWALPMDIHQGKATGKPWLVHALESRVAHYLTYCNATRSMVFKGNLRENNLVLLDLTEPPPLVPRKLKTSGWTVVPVCWFPDGRRLLLRETSPKFQDQALIMDVASGELFSPDCYPDSARAVGLDDDGRHVYLRLKDQRLMAWPWDCGPPVDLGFSLDSQDSWLEVVSPSQNQGESLVLYQDAGNTLRIHEVSLVTGVGPELDPILFELDDLNAQWWAWAQLSYDGRTFALGEYKPDIKLLDRETDSTTIVASGLDLVKHLRWSWDNQWVYCAGRKEGKNCIGRVKVDTGESEILWSANTGMILFPDPSPKNDILVGIHLPLSSALFLLEGI